MINLSQIFHIAFWPAVILFAVLIVIAAVFAFFEEKGSTDFSEYEKRPFLFDTKTELELFNILLELFGDKFYIFPQVAYSHIVQTKKGLPEKERFVAWNRINRKSADFVLCDKVQIMPQLVIELDGSSHQLPSRVERDNFVDEMLAKSNMPIAHIKTSNLNKDYVKAEVNRASGL